MSEKANPGKPKQPGIFSLLAPYKGLIALLLLFALLSNGVNLWLPKLVADGIDDYTRQQFDLDAILTEFTGAVIFIFVFAYLQSIIQTYASEKVARDLRTKLADKISKQSHAFIEETTAAKLLTNLTADIDSIKMFVSQAIVAIVSSLFLIIGASVLLLSINWKLALTVLAIIPIIGGMFAITLKKVRTLFVQSREVIDWLNKIINESILGSALIRVVNSQQLEYAKFLEANTKAKGFGLAILSLFAGLIPVVTFTANVSMLTILVLGGHFVIEGDMTLGSFAAFNSYLGILIFPILVIGFMSNVIAQATASYQRISGVLNIADPVPGGASTEPLHGNVSLEQVTVRYGEKPALKDVTFSVSAGSRIAVIGPTAAGKTQLLYLLTGLIKPQEGRITFDGHPIDYYDSESFHRQVGFVFQDSIIFNMSIRENIAFSTTVTNESLQKAIDTAELTAFIETLPDGLDTIVSERGTSLSGGQKQRIMLARALAMNPKVLLLDDFTARVDNTTEKKILANVERNYPGITLISVTQKIAAIEHYDQIVVLMEGELIGCGTHDELMLTSPEYVQIFNSQQSTSNYELRS
ncbi:ATP-binding cassette subfamily B protein [Dyadobacter sp. BE34]|uniref:ATP-binding cassette subfamily B protein n=1 Tax=Dyadobacter fermentans TaxID=94254 RepID=A0ABU1R559_9BACT|nr:MULTISPECIES: ABC transporter ATP-binding protein [Dyadobacter]MDR6808541.1 ATP-binding cassette subfamily B protein [Dyadobacter fermentans]MDR7046284.1 ATP-binding cassette subfamily B protein [Dyadobacter sp. BE242]MDR7200597.1 ATP-binding cassette subfamily B protein [Dyadobacter sp. BE34]MDR7218557.1 ATP-binding cassette subfamily B protein [Dyadobacter sp. BE31]MDR7266487.1 ATP-binding cassette subfamily B protein [Dyadobacter sp. BE32]